MLGIRLAPDLEKRLERLAKKTGPEQELLRQARYPAVSGGSRGLSAGHSCAGTQRAKGFAGRPGARTWPGRLSFNLPHKSSFASLIAPFNSASATISAIESWQPRIHGNWVRRSPAIKAGYGGIASATIAPSARSRTSAWSCWFWRSAIAVRSTADSRPYASWPSNWRCRRSARRYPSSSLPRSIP